MFQRVTGKEPIRRTLDIFGLYVLWCGDKFFCPCIKKLVSRCHVLCAMFSTWPCDSQGFVIVLVLLLVIPLQILSPIIIFSFYPILKTSAKILLMNVATLCNGHLKIINEFPELGLVLHHLRAWKGISIQHSAHKLEECDNNKTWIAWFSCVLEQASRIT